MANRKEVKRADFEFAPFSKKQLRILTFWHKDSPLKDRFMVIADGSIRSGKEQPHDARIYTPEGYTTMGKVQVGDYVMTRKGMPSRVKGKYPQGKKDVYRVEFDDKSFTECGIDHLWQFSRNKKATTLSFQAVEPLSYFINNPLAKYYRFPITQPVEFTGRKIENPFLLGVLMIAGNEEENEWLISTENREVHERISKLVPSYIPEYKLGVGIGRVPKVSITENIIYTSIETREKILEGAIKAKGVTWDYYVRLSFRKKEYAQIMIDIIRSLGYYVRKNKYSSDYVCEIYITPRLTKLMTEVQVKDITQIKPHEFKRIKSIELVGQKECSCIEVEDEEHLYLTDNFIVTHNTVSMTLSFVLFVMNNFYDANAAICGKSVGTVRRNIIPILKQMMAGIGYEVIDHRSENYLEIKMDDITNYFYLFGARFIIGTYIWKHI